LTLSNVSSSQLQGQLSIQRELDLVLNHFKEVDIARKVIVNQKLLDTIFPLMTSMLLLASKIKMKAT